VAFTDLPPFFRALYVIIDYAMRRISVAKDATRSVIEMADPDSMAEGAGSKVTTGCVRWQVDANSARRSLGMAR
jgi:hypothetical protein